MRGLLYFCLCFSIHAMAQLETSYQSKADQLLEIEKIMILPTIDNIDGIYARPIDNYIKEKVDGSTRFKLVDTRYVGRFLSALDLSDSPKEVRRITKNAKADALITTSISKNKGGVSIKMSLFLGEDGKLLMEETTLNYTRYEIKEIKARTGMLYKKLVNKLPYDALVLSRSGNKVTVGLGKKDGIQRNQIITAINIIKNKRHPKFNFLVGSEKESLGKIKILKVDDTLSFGIILSEKDKNVISKNTKVSGVSFIQYADVDPFNTGPKNSSKNISGNKISFGANPKEWVPVSPPTIGSASILLGLGNYNTNTSNGTNDVSASKNIYPSIHLNGEIWFTSKWTMELELNQGVMEVSNPGSTGAANLNISTTEWNMNLAYGLLMNDDFFGPKIQALVGFTNYKRFIDNSDFTTTSYSGIALGLRGSTPVGRTKDLRFGVDMFFQLTGSLTESSSTSGTGDRNTINRYSFFGEKRFKENIYLTGGLFFNSYATNFSSGSISQRTTKFAGGLKYLF
ncbi:MAG: hypothetical protein AB8E15_00510 [Bdellovibrionales bacterium]